MGHREAAERVGAKIERHFAELGGWIEAPPATWGARGAEGGWSVGEICEHVALANHFLLLLAQKIADRGMRRAARGELPPPEASRTSGLAALASREFRWARPDHMAPSGQLERGELRARLAQQRAQCRTLVEAVASGAGALHRIRMSVVGERLDLHQMLAFIAMHMQRHLGQIERITGKAREGDGGC